MKKKLKKSKHIYVIRFENCEMSESVKSFLENHFPDSLSDRFVERVVAIIPNSIFIKMLAEVIDEMDDYWRRVPNLEGLGYNHNDELSQELQERFGLSEDSNGIYWSQIAIKCFDLDGLSRAHKDTTFVDVYDNEMLLKKLTEFWRDNSLMKVKGKDF